MTRWLRRFWRRLRGRCPCCGAHLLFGSTTLPSGLWVPASACMERCGFWRDYTVDGSAFEHWPEHAP